MSADETPSETAFFNVSTAVIVSASREVFLMGYEVGCRHMGHMATTSEERRVLDREEAVEQISDKLIDAFGVLLKALPRKPPSP